MSYLNQIKPFEIVHLSKALNAINISRQVTFSSPFWLSETYHYLPTISFYSTL